MTLEIGTIVREKPEYAIKNDAMLKMLNTFTGHNWNEVPDQLEGTVDGVDATRTQEHGETVYLVRYTNAPSWAPDVSGYYEDHLEVVEA